MSAVWALTPQQSIERECALRGRADVVAGCVRLITGEDVDPGLLLALGGPAAEKFLDGAEHADTYWLRVWGVRGLLWAGDGGSVRPSVRSLRCVRTRSPGSARPGRARSRC